MVMMAAALLSGRLLYAQDAFSRGEDLFMRNKAAEALPLLEAAAAADPANITPSLYLGIVYLQLDRVDDAIALYLKILPSGGGETARIAFNLGNAYYVKGDTGAAEQYYGLSIEADPAYAPAYLNRANTRVRAGNPGDAVPDYRRYLSLEPASPKRPGIERLVDYIAAEAGEEGSPERASEETPAPPLPEGLEDPDPPAGEPEFHLEEFGDE
jgi:tetratricopeptide (TPR) repeat protein